MFIYDKDVFRAVEAKKREILCEMEREKNRIIKELSGVDHETMTRMRQLLADYNDIDYRNTVKFNNMVAEHNLLKDELKNEAEKIMEDIQNITVTPEMFGAVGDGVTNDSGAFTRALQFGNVLLTKDYNIGTLVYNGDVKIHSNKNAKIKGSLHVYGKFEADNCTFIQDSSDSGWCVYVAGDTRINNCYFDCNNQVKNSCLTVHKAENAVITNSVFVNNQGRHGVSVVSSNNVVISECIVENIGGAGIQCLDVCKNVQIINNIVMNANHYTNGSAGSDGCISTYGDTTGTGTTQSENFVIAFNIIYNDSADDNIGVCSIRINGVKNCQVVGNAINHEAFNGIIVNNRTHDTDGVRYVVVNENVNVENNIITSKSVQCAIRAMSGKNVSIVNNKITNTCELTDEFPLIVVGSNETAIEDIINVVGNIIRAESAKNSRPIQIFAGSSIVYKNNDNKTGRGLISSADKQWILNNILHNHGHNFCASINAGKLFMCNNIYGYAHHSTGSLQVADAVTVVINENNNADYSMFAE